MGSKQSKSPSGYYYRSQRLQQQQQQQQPEAYYGDENYYNYQTKQRQQQQQQQAVKRHKSNMNLHQQQHQKYPYHHQPSNNNNNINKSKTLMTIAPPPPPPPPSSNNHTLRPRNINQQPKATNTTTINKMMNNNNQHQQHSPSSFHINSKLYKPNSFLIANQHNPIVIDDKEQQQQQHRRAPPPPPTRARCQRPAQQQHVKQRPVSHHYSSTNNNYYIAQQQQPVESSTTASPSSSSSATNVNKVPLAKSAAAKRWGISPRFKRKIVETIANRVAAAGQLNDLSSSARDNPYATLPHHHQHHHQSRQHRRDESGRKVYASSSQWNIFSNNNSSRREGLKKRINSNGTLLSTSIERNSLRYASRRKYKTQSLANPYRHANTNYPVYTHEALFMPEFSVKGQVTEADFEILDVISRGAFGHVIKVRKKRSPDEMIDENGSSSSSSDNGGGNDNVYAMKIMWKSQVIRDRALQQVKDEVTIATSCLDNPLIVKTWYYWQSKRFLYIITDYVENGELLSLWLKVHHFPERLVALYAVEMSLVLDYLHRRGVIYRDIKMENILLDQRGHIQLIDFGLSKWLSLGDKTSTICGTIQYMAPEILSVEPYDHAVDWWSLGILIYALLSGEYPLNAAKDHIQMNEKVSKHIFELPTRNSTHFSSEARDIVRKLLRKSSQRRLKSLLEIKQDAFFLREVNHFVQAYTSKQQSPSKLDADTEQRILSDNFWNPYVIMQNYSPLQILFDEINAVKQQQKNHSNSQVKQQQQQQPVQSKDIESTTTATTSNSSSQASSSSINTGKQHHRKTVDIDNNAAVSGPVMSYDNPGMMLETDDDDEEEEEHHVKKMSQQKMIPRDSNSSSDDDESNREDMMEEDDDDIEIKEHAVVATTAAGDFTTF